MKSTLKFKWLIPLLLLAFAALGAAQDEEVDPPTRVARLQFTTGEVSLQPGGVDDWTFAPLNRPLTTADRLWADRDSRAELSIGSAALRLGGETSIGFTNLSDNVAQVELDQGTLDVSVRYLNEGDVVEIDTPNIAFTASEPGEYRIDVNPDEDRTWVQVRHGSGTASGQEASALLQEGQLYEFSNGDSGQYTVGELGPPDEFDTWCERREQREMASVSARYVALGTIGYTSLDGAGDWQTMPEYGAVWFPYVSAGWAPYHDGHWIWVEPWGWTWVDDEPWGFAPFHYGRWAYVRNRWGWIPGPRRVRPVYAPALVAWIGGPNFGVSIGIGGGGGVGWVPLGWRDPYIPYYHVSPRYAREVNISNSRVVNTTIINNYYSTTNVNVRNRTIQNIRYENVRVQNAVTVVPGNALASGRSVRQAAVAVTPQTMNRATFGRAPAVVPTRQAVLGPRQTAPPPARMVIPKQVVAKRPPPPPPVSFDRQRPLLEKSQGMPLRTAERATLRKTAPPPAAHVRPPVVTVAPKTRQAPPVANKPATPPRPLVGARPTPGTPGTPAGRPVAPTLPGRPAPGGREALTPGAHPAIPARPATPSGRELPGARPATPATPATPAAPAAGRELNRPQVGARPTPFERPTAPAQGREMNRPATPPERTVEPGQPNRPAPQERTMERPAPPSRPAPQERTMERPAPPSRPAPQERTMERPATPSRPAPQERTTERPAPPSRPAPQERTMERPATPSRPAPQERTTERPAARPPEAKAPEQRRPPRENPSENRDNRDKNNPER